MRVNGTKSKLGTLVSICLLTSTLLALSGNSFPTAEAIYGSSNYFYEVTGISDTPRAVDVDSEGRIFVMTKENDIWRSTDGGTTWSEVWTGSGSCGALFVMVTRDDYIIVPTGTNSHLYRSTDHGDTWTSVCNDGYTKWHWGETSNGTLLINYYSDNNPYVIRSTDKGENWSIWFNMTEQGYDCKHFHVVRVNPYNDDIWIASGDGTNKSHVLMLKNGTNTWTKVASLQPTDFMFDPNWVYIVPDGAREVWACPHRNVDESNFTDCAKIVWYAGFSGDGSGNFGYWGNKIENENIWLWGTQMGQLWGSWDGDHWVKIFENQDVHVDHISTRKPIYFVQRAPGKLYHLTVTSDDIKFMYYEQFRSVSGGIDNIGTSTTVIEQLIPNGTSYIDLDEVVVTNPQATIKGYSRKNLLNNSGWEKGDYSEWSFDGVGTKGVTSSVKYHGMYSLYVNKSTTDAFTLDIYQGSPQSKIEIDKSDILTMSGYVKTNTSVSDDIFSMAIYSYDKGYPVTWATFSANTSWQRFSISYVSDIDNNSLKCTFRIERDSFVNFTAYLDACMLELKPEYMARWESVEEKPAIQRLQWKPLSTYYDGIGNTTNPTLTLNGENVAYSGELENGTASPATSLSTLSGVIEVVANIQGSQLCTLRINGKTHTKISNGHIFNYHNSIPYGVYYGTPTITSSYFVILADKKSWIVENSQQYDSSNVKLTFQVNAPSGYNGTVKVYCATYGEPRTITGTTSNSYDENTKIETVTVTYSSSQTITFEWAAIAINYDATYTTTTSVTLTLALAGIAEMRFSNDNTTWTPWEPYATSKAWNLTTGDGTKTVYGQFKDNVGLISRSYSDTIILDTTSPSGSITIAEGSEYTNTKSVMLTLSAIDATSGIAQMRFSNNGTTWSVWEAYTTSKSWTLLVGEGTKTVYVQYMDNAGLISLSYHNAIILDTAKPTANAGFDQADAEDMLVTFNGSASWDENGITSYAWTFTDVTPQTLTDVTPTYDFTIPGTYIVTLTVTDSAGNNATDTVTITVLLDTDGDRVPDVVDSDDDNDGMPDIWETGNGLAPLDAADASLDPDGDGLTNLEEYQGGTNPNVSDAETLPTEALPPWILGVAVAAVIIGIAVAATFLWKRRK